MTIRECRNTHLRLFGAVYLAAILPFAATKISLGFVIVSIAIVFILHLIAVSFCTLDHLRHYREFGLEAEERARFDLISTCFKSVSTASAVFAIVVAFVRLEPVIECPVVDSKIAQSVPTSTSPPIYHASDTPSEYSNLSQRGRDMPKKNMSETLKERGQEILCFVKKKSEDSSPIYVAAIVIYALLLATSTGIDLGVKIFVLRPERYLVTRVSGPG